MSLNQLEESPESHKRKVLIAIDGSENSSRIIQWSIENILVPDLHIAVLTHVREGAIPQIEYSFYAAPQEFPEPLTLDSNYHESHQMILDLAIPLIENSITTNGIVLKGDICEALISQAVEVNAEMIIIGSSKEKWIIRQILGSVADSVIQNAPCTVVIAK